MRFALKAVELLLESINTLNQCKKVIEKSGDAEKLEKINELIAIFEEFLKKLKKFICEAYLPTLDEDIRRILKNYYFIYSRDKSFKRWQSAVKKAGFDDSIWDSMRKRIQRANRKYFGEDKLRFRESPKGKNTKV